MSNNPHFQPSEKSKPPRLIMSNTMNKVKMVKLGDVAPSGSAKDDIPDSGQVWNLTLDQIESHTGFISNRQYLDISKVPTSANFVNEDNVLYSKLRPYLNKVVIPDQFACATSELVPLKPDSARLDMRYLLHYLRSKQFVSWASIVVAGAKMPRLNMKELWKHEIPLPPLPEQKRIAEILDLADEARRKRRENLKLYDDLIRSLFLQTFGDPVSNPKGMNTDIS